MTADEVPDESVYVVRFFGLADVSVGVEAETPVEAESEARVVLEEVLGRLDLDEHALHGVTFEWRLASIEEP